MIESVINVLGYMTFVCLIIISVGAFVAFCSICLSELWSKGCSYTDYLTHRTEFKMWLRMKGNVDENN